MSVNVIIINIIKIKTSLRIHAIYLPPFCSPHGFMSAHSPSNQFFSQDWSLFFNHLFEILFYSSCISTSATAPTDFFLSFSSLPIRFSLGSTFRILTLTKVSPHLNLSHPNLDQTLSFVSFQALLFCPKVIIGQTPSSLRSSLFYSKHYMR